MLRYGRLLMITQVSSNSHVYIIPQYLTWHDQITMVKRVSLQICQMLASNGTQRVWSDVQKVPYLIYGGNQWVGYDDEQSLTGKVSIEPYCARIKLLNNALSILLE
jgi:GH18 family chitinase